MFVSMGAVRGPSFLPLPYASDTNNGTSSGNRNPPSAFPISRCFFLYCTRSAPKTRFASVLVSSTANTGGLQHQQEQAVDGDLEATDSGRQSRRSADWKAARAYKESGVIHEGKIEGFNGGGLLVRFYSLVGFLPYPQLSPYHSCKEPNKSIQEIAKDLIGSYISLKVIQVNEENRKLIFSEKDAMWSKFSGQVNAGDIFEARVGSLEDYGAFVHLRFPDGGYYLTGLVHVSEVSWDLVQDVRDILNEGDEVKAKVVQIDREKSRITLSLKQLEDDPLLETLDQVISRADSGTWSMSDVSNSEPLPGLESICKELLQEDGITDVRIGRKGFEKRVVSQDLELWLSNAPVKDKQFTLLARAGREVQEVYLTTGLNQEDIKKALQRVLGRIP